MDLEISINYIENPDAFHAILADFERQHNVKIDLQIFNWAEAWSELMKISLYERGPIVSEAGTTWMGSLAAKNSLRPIKEREVAACGGAAAFLPEAWQTCFDNDRKTILAIPWSLNTFLLYYRRDLLAKAGVDESAAFNSYANFVHTLESLLKAGVNLPIAIPNTGNSLQLFHNASSFVWGAGGDWINANGTKVQFTHPKTLAGLKDYFGLHRFMAYPARNLYDDACNHMFIEGKAAITLRSPDLLHQIRHGKVSEEVIQNTGVSMQPGVPFVGGSNLIVWKHLPAAQDSLAIEFLKFMTSTEIMMREFQDIWLVPANLEALNQVEADPDYTVLAQCIKAGRAYKRVPLWGLVEDRLVKAMTSIWHAIFTTPEPNIDQIIQSTLLPLEERLNLTLSQ